MGTPHNDLTDAPWQPPAPAPPWRQFVRAPLTPLALAATVGVLLHQSAWLVLPAVPLCAILARRHTVPIALLCTVVCLFGWHMHLALTATDAAREALQLHGSRVLTVRGTLSDDPVLRPSHSSDPLQPPQLHDVVVLPLNTEQYGALRLRVSTAKGQGAALANALALGDTVECTGQYKPTARAMNPGEADGVEYEKRQSLAGQLHVRGADAVTRLEPAGWSVGQWLNSLRRLSRRQLETHLTGVQAATGRALLLGDGSALERTEWERYIRTGTVHVLAISGQHLVLLAGVLWCVLGLCGVRRVPLAYLVAGVVVGYALLTGMRPSAVRATVMVVCLCGAVVLRRPLDVANSFLLAWIVVLLLNPLDVLDLGCALSFISVSVLVWGVGRWSAPKPHSALDQLIDASRPAWLRAVRKTGKVLLAGYAVNAVLFVVNSPLLMYQQHVISPIGLLVGPVLILLTSIALVSGFVLLVLGWVPVIGPVCGSVTQWSLELCHASVGLAEQCPGGVVWVPAPPLWWLLGFYAAFNLGVLLEWQAKKLWIFGVVAWCLLGSWCIRPTGTHGELRITFLAVGHGGCVVLETPDGRVLLYDTGSTVGPDATRRIIAPYLWHRGHRHIDELFISHADSDHFNGLGSLLDRFPVGRVHLTPSFVNKPTAEVREALRLIEAKQLPLRITRSGDEFTAGDVTLRVLHPPETGPDGTENSRSLVLAVQHAGHTVLLTGDLDGAGTELLTAQPGVQPDVLQAPHHGSPTAYTTELHRWSRAALVVACRSERYAHRVNAQQTGVTTWDTAHDGAITVRSHATALLANTWIDPRPVVLPTRAK